MRTVDVVISTKDTTSYDYLLNPGEHVVKAEQLKEETQSAIASNRLWEHEIMVRVYIEVHKASTGLGTIGDIWPK